MSLVWPFHTWLSRKKKNSKRSRLLRHRRFWVEELERRELLASGLLGGGSEFLGGFNDNGAILGGGGNTGGGDTGGGGAGGGGAGGGTTGGQTGGGLDNEDADLIPEMKAHPTGIFAEIAGLNSPAQQFVIGLYHDLLQRLPLGMEVNGWVNQLASGMTRLQVAQQFMASREYFANAITDRYVNLLGRQPEAGAVDSWLQVVYAGLTPEQITARFLGSREFYQAHGDGIQPWLETVYQGELGRDVDSAGLNTWSAAILGGTALSDVAGAIMSSGEWQTQTVAGIYHYLLDRAPDSGASTWVSALENGASVSDVVCSIASSDEYYNLQSTIDRVVQNQNLLSDAGNEDDGPLGDGGTTGDGSGTSGTGNQPQLPTPPIPIRQPAKVESFGNTPRGGQNGNLVGSQVLTDLSDGYAQALANGKGDAFLTQEKTFLFIDDSQRVLVNVRADATTDLSAFQDDLTKQLNMVVTGTTLDQRMITGYVPIDQVLEVNSVAGYAGVTPVYAPHFSAGSVTSEGDHLIGADTFRATTGITGAGVRVGVISDSVNQRDSGADGNPDVGIAESVRTGDLPAAGVMVLQDGPATAQDEGRGMLEVVHDVAPGASLAFHTGDAGPQNMAQGILDLAAKARVKVIADDVQYPDEPFFNDGLLAQTVDQAAIDYGVLYLSAAGNNADHAWESQFHATTANVAGSTGTFHSFGSGSQPLLQHFSLAPGQTLDMSFQWDAAFLEGGSSLPQYQVPNEVDVLITDANGNQLIKRFGDNTEQTGEALQRVVFTNDGTLGTNDFAMAFQLVNGPAPTRLKWIRFDDNAPAQYQGAGTIFGHAAARNAITVGAVPYNDPTTPEPFSSQGKVTIAFDENGKRLEEPFQRYKPDLVGPDGVHTANFPIESGPMPTFFGTSAAVAHLAGLGALERAQVPSDSYWSFVLKMEHKAIAVGTPGWNATSGFGLDPINPPPPLIPITNPAWTETGPAPLTKHLQLAGNREASGRITGIAADPSNPNVIYVAATGGGVWKTADGGTTWTPLTDAQSTLTMGAIAIAPSAPQTIYAGTGEADNSGDSLYGRGILKSTDGGASWTLLNNNGVFDRLAVVKIAVDPGNANNVFAAMSTNTVLGASGNAGIWKSTDGGATWTNTTTGINGVTGTTQFTDVIVDPTNGSRLFCAIGDDFGGPANGVYVTTNAGGSWAISGNWPIGTQGVTRVAISKSNPQILYAAVADTSAALDSIKKTTDGGTTWNNVTNQPPNYMGNQGDYDNVIAINPSDPNNVFVGGQLTGNNAQGIFTGGVFETTDGGTSWADITIGAAGDNGPHPDHHAMTFDASGKLLDGNDGGIWRLENPATSSIQWADLNTNLATIQFVGFALNPLDPNLAYGGAQDNGTDKFTGALGWLNVDGGDGGFVRVDQTNPNTVYHTFPFGPGFMARSDDAGVTWIDITNGINTGDNAQFYPPYVMDPSNSARLVLGTDHIYETTNKGGSWKAIGTPGSGGFNPSIDSVTALAISSTSSNTIYAAAGPANIFVTTNDGASWTLHNIPNITDHIQDLVVDPTNSLVCYAVRDQFGQGKVFRTADGGATWTDISGNLPDLPASALTLDPGTGQLWVGNDNGVFTSLDGGTTWAPYGIGLPNARVTNIELNTTLHLLAVSTYGRSTWEISTIPGGQGGGGGGGGLPPEISLPDDVFESNENSNTPTDFGIMTAGPQVFDNLTVNKHANGIYDFDWYRWTIGQDGTFTGTITLEPVTGSGNLELHLFTINGQTLTEIARTQTSAGNQSVSLNTTVTAGELMFVEVKGVNSVFSRKDQSPYKLSVDLE